MLVFFNNRNNRIRVQENNVFINNRYNKIGKEIEINPVFEFINPIPEIKIYENDQLIRVFKIEALEGNPILTGYFLHSSIRILPNSAVMIDGIISSDKESFPKWTDRNYEAVRFQPFYLSNSNDFNLQLKGKGLFERGLHFNGTITPTTVRNICICDSCNQSFTIQHFHAGFSDAQYFYSSDSKETLAVSYGMIENLPTQLQEEANPALLEKIEMMFPLPSNGEGSFNYYNPFRCPHCLEPYIDFNKAIRSKEYYGNFYINQKPKWFEKAILP